MVMHYVTLAGQEARRLAIFSALLLLVMFLSSNPKTMMVLKQFLYQRRITASCLPERNLQITIRTCKTWLIHLHSRGMEDNRHLLIALPAASGIVMHYVTLAVQEVR